MNYSPSKGFTNHETGLVGVMVTPVMNSGQKGLKEVDFFSSEIFLNFQTSSLRLARSYERFSLRAV